MMTIQGIVIAIICGCSFIHNFSDGQCHNGQWNSKSDIITGLSGGLALIVLDDAMDTLYSDFSIQICTGVVHWITKIKSSYDIS